MRPLLTFSPHLYPFPFPALSSMGKGIEWIEQHDEARENVTTMLTMAIGETL